MPHDIAGVLPIAHTPFREDDLIAAESLVGQIDWAFEIGANGFCTGMHSSEVTTRRPTESTFRFVPS